MKSPITYTQCRLRRGTTEMVSWIPSVFAGLNRYLKLKTDDGWEDGWQVVSVGREESESYIKEHRDAYRTQREASDV